MYYVVHDMIASHASKSCHNDSAWAVVISIRKRRSKSFHLCGHDEVNAVLVGLLSVRAEPKPLQSACSGLLALCSKVGGHRDAELGVVRGQLSKVLIGVRSERDQRLSNQGVCGKVDDRDVARAFVRNR